MRQPLLPLEVLMNVCTKRELFFDRGSSPDDDLVEHGAALVRECRRGGLSDGTRLRVTTAW